MNGSSKKTSLKGTVSAALVALVCMVASTATQAQEPHKSPAERAVEYRQSLYTVLAGNFGPVHMMADGKMPFSAPEAAKRSERAAFVAKMLDDAFPPESKGVAHTDAKPNIWTDKEEFQKQMQALVDRTEALSVAAKTGDLAKVKAATEEAAKSCKGCHDKFKKE